MKKLVCSFLLSAFALPLFAINSVVSTPNAPSAIGPYSQAIQTTGMLFLSGQIAIDPKTGTLQTFDGDIQKQTSLVLSNIEAILNAAGCKKRDVVKTTILLAKISDFDAVNIAYSDFFGAHKPARSTYAVAALPKGAQIEIEAVAACAGHRYHE